MRIFTACLAIVAALLPLQAFPEYKLSVTPRFAPEVILKRAGPLAERLGDALAEEVTIQMAADFEDFESLLKSGVIDIAYVNPYIYPLASKVHEALVTVSKGAGGSRLRGLIITRADSDIVSVEDLQGRSAVIVSFKSIGGYLSQKVTLAEAGIDTETDMRLEEARGNKQENVVLSVYYGDADVGFLREDAQHIADRYVPPTQIRVIRRTAWMPSWAVSVNRSLSQGVKDKIRSTLLELEPGDPVLEALKANKFVPATDADYDVIRRAAGIPIPQR